MFLLRKMGCLFSRPSESDSPKRIQNATPAEPKQYSWDNRPKLDPKLYIIDGAKDETLGRLPGTVNGQQFIIKNCENCNIYIFDNCDTISVDDCVNCRIFLGPINTSVFIRDCTDCKLVLACQQFRTRDCKGIDVLLACDTQPIIEASTKMRFGCFQYHYPELEEQFKTSGISIFSNNWSTIHDFTPVPGENNYTLLPEEAGKDFLPLPDAEPFSGVQISTDPDKSVVPVTAGTRRKGADESCLVVFFNDGLSHDRAKRFLDTMKTEHPGCVLMQSKEFTMQPMQAQTVFVTESYEASISRGPVIGFHVNGEGSVKACQDMCVGISQGSTGLTYASSNPASADTQIENFYNFADMQMSV